MEEETFGATNKKIIYSYPVFSGAAVLLVVFPLGTVVGAVLMHCYKKQQQRRQPMQGSPSTSIHTYEEVTWKLQGTDLTHNEAYGVPMQH